jgi:hypothetical protein
MAKKWKKGRGKLGFLDPLIGHWVADAESPMGPLRCTRSFERILGGSYLQLDALWLFGKSVAAADCDAPGTEVGKGGYRERAMIGAGDDGVVSFWSFTSDGKRSQGKVADVSDIDPEAIGFEAQMPAGLARMAYWPDEDGAGFYWAVEAKNKKGWKRFTSHHYRPAK